MDFQNCGFDSTGRMVFIPVIQNQTNSPQSISTNSSFISQEESSVVKQQEINIKQSAQQMVVPTHQDGQKNRSRSIFNSFFIIEDGVISLSLRDMTLISCLAITFSLLYFLYQSCTNGYVECTYPVLPMISDCICLPYYDRIFCLLSTFFTFACFQIDMRAFYNRLYGIATDCQNDTMLVVGLVATFTLPAIGYFDEHTYGTIHGICAVLFFLSVGVYAWILSSVMTSNKMKFPAAQWGDIALLQKIKNLMWMFLVALLLSITFKGSNFWLTSLAEWMTTILFLNFFVFLSFINQYFDTVHPYDTQLTQSTQQINNAPVVYLPSTQCQNNVIQYQVISTNQSQSNICV